MDRRESGIAHILLIVFIIAVLAIGGYLFWQNNQTHQNTEGAGQVSVADYYSVFAKTIVDIKVFNIDYEETSGSNVVYGDGDLVRLTFERPSGSTSEVLTWKDYGDRDGVLVDKKLTVSTGIANLHIEPHLTAYHKIGHVRNDEDFPDTVAIPTMMLFTPISGDPEPYVYRIPTYEWSYATDKYIYSDTSYHYTGKTSEDPSCSELNAHYLVKGCSLKVNEVYNSETGEELGNWEFVCEVKKPGLKEDALALCDKIVGSIEIERLD